jgi:hypothetical protein
MEGRDGQGDGSVSVNKLAEHLYTTFWQRNNVKNPAPLGEQATAIIKMWTNIALSAIDFKENK